MLDRAFLSKTLRLEALGTDLRMFSTNLAAQLGEQFFQL